VCCAAQPATVNGSPEHLVDAGVASGAEITKRWAQQIADACSGRDTEAGIRGAIAAAGERFDTHAFAKVVEEQILRSLMLGILDVDWEVQHEDEVEIAKFAATGTDTAGAFGHLPFAEAIAEFRKREVMPRAAFDLLEREAKRKAFTVAGLAKQELLDTAHAELIRQLQGSQGRTQKDPETGWVYEGPNLREFEKFVRERLESAGWTPSNPSHVETIYRTNVASAYATGRHAQMTSPAVVALMPYWQIRGVDDSRARPAHKRAHGVILPANHPFWKRAYPPFGYNCRCRVVARSQRWIDQHKAPIGPEPQGLPDPDFDSGTRVLPTVPPSLQTPPAKPANDSAQQAPPAPPPPAAPQVGPGALPVSIPFEGPKPPPPPPPAVLPPPPPTPKPAVASAENVLAKKISDATGSNPGGVYEGLDGKKRYVKFYDDPAQAAGEHIANKIYAKLGLGTVKSVTFVRDGKLAYASELIPKAKTLADKGLTRGLAKKALEGFAADVLTANWDAAGLGLENIVVDARGKLFRIDNGGALLSRANAGRKPVEALGNVTEWESFFDPSVNPGYARLAEAASVTSAEELGDAAIRGIKRIIELRRDVGGWRKFVEAEGKFLTAFDRERMIGMLEARTSFLEGKLTEITKPAAWPPRP